MGRWLLQRNRENQDDPLLFRYCPQVGKPNATAEDSKDLSAHVHISGLSNHFSLFKLKFCVDGNIVVAMSGPICKNVNSLRDCNATCHAFLYE